MRILEGKRQQNIQLKKRIFKQRTLGYTVLTFLKLAFHQQVIRGQ